MYNRYTITYLKKANQVLEPIGTNKKTVWHSD
jgi:hypothetical protein